MRASSRAKYCPMQLRGPAVKGMNCTTIASSAWTAGHESTASEHEGWAAKSNRMQPWQGKVLHGSDSRDGSPASEFSCSTWPSNTKCLLLNKVVSGVPCSAGHHPESCQTRHQGGTVAVATGQAASTAGAQPASCKASGELMLVSEITHEKPGLTSRHKIQS